MVYVHRFIVFVMLAWLPSMANAQTTKSNAFHSMVLEAMAARGALEAGQFDYRFRYFSSKHDGFVWKKTGSYAFDLRTNEVVHGFHQTFAKDGPDPNPFGAVPNGGIAQRTKDGLMFRGGGLFSPKGSYLFYLQNLGGRQKAIDNPEKSPLITPFDFKSFGFAFYGDISRVTSYDRVLSNYLIVDGSDIAKVRPTEIPKAMMPAVKGATYFNYGGCILCVEPERDYWVTHARFAIPGNSSPDAKGLTTSKEILQSSCKMDLKQIDGFWVPQHVVYRSKGDRFDIELDWKRVNPPQNTIKFSIETLSAQIEKPVTAM